MSNQPLSPQGYNLGRNPKNTNPFFDIIRRGVTATIAVGQVIVNTLSAGEDATVSVENAGTATDGVFDFTFGIPTGPRVLKVIPEKLVPRVRLVPRERLDRRVLKAMMERTLYP